MAWKKTFNHQKEGDKQRDARRWDLAAAAYKKHLAVHPDDARIWVQYGHALKESKQFKAAETAYMAATSLADDPTDAWTHLAHLLKSQDKFPAALAAFREVAERSPSSEVDEELLKLRIRMSDMSGHALLRISPICKGGDWSSDRPEPGSVDLPIKLISATPWPLELRGGRESIAMRGSVAAISLQRTIEAASLRCMTKPAPQAEEPAPEVRANEPEFPTGQELAREADLPLYEPAVEEVPANEALSASLQLSLVAKTGSIPTFRWLRHPVRSLQAFLLWVLDNSAVAQELRILRQTNAALAMQIEGFDRAIEGLRASTVESRAQQYSDRMLLQANLVGELGALIQDKSRADQDALREVGRNINDAIVDGGRQLLEIHQDIASLALLIKSGFDQAKSDRMLLQANLVGELGALIQDKSRADQDALREVGRNINDAIVDGGRQLPEIRQDIASLALLIESGFDEAKGVSVPVLGAIHALSKANLHNTGLLQSALDKQLSALLSVADEYRGALADVAKRVELHQQEARRIVPAVNQQRDEIALLCGVVQSQVAATDAMRLQVQQHKRESTEIWKVAGRYLVEFESLRTTLESSIAELLQDDLKNLEAVIDKNHAALNLLVEQAAKINAQAGDMRQSLGQHYTSICDLFDRKFVNMSSRISTSFDLISKKNDFLIHRQVIPVPKVGHVLTRNELGVFAIPESDVDTISYYASGELPEPGSISVLRRLLKNGSTFVDVGANVGLFTVAAARQVGPTGRIISIEPAPATAAALHMTTRLNGIFPFTSIHNVAAGREEGEAELNLGQICGHSSLLPLEGAAGIVTVQVSALDSIIGPTHVDLIKIDVEGAELDVLEGLSITLSSNPNLAIIIEFAPIHLSRAGRSISDWEDILSRHALHAFAIDEVTGSLEPKQLQDLMSVHSVNLLLSRSNQPGLADG